MLAALVGLLSALSIAVAVSPTSSAFVASILNSRNIAGTGTLLMEETSGTGTPVTCTSNTGATIGSNEATCTTINAFGGSLAMVPGTPVVTQVTIKNTGTVQASTFTLTPGTTCTQSGNGPANGTATDLCAKITLSVTRGASQTQVFSGTLAALATSAAMNLPALAPGASENFTFTATLSAAADNKYQGLQATVPLTWAFTA